MKDERREAPHSIVSLLHLPGVFVAGNVKYPDQLCTVGFLNILINYTRH